MPTFMSASACPRRKRLDYEAGDDLAKPRQLCKAMFGIQRGAQSTSCINLPPKTAWTQSAEYSCPWENPRADLPSPTATCIDAHFKGDKPG